MHTEIRDIQRQVLPNGLVVVTETMPHVRSVSVGVWVRTGSRSEPAAHNGLAHFLEHMVFKGTERRSAEEIARSMDSVGGMLDAFTAKELTCFNAKVLDEHLPIAFDVISDLILRPLFAPADIEKEKQVVLEEIKMDMDSPEHVLHELFTQGFWPNHPLGRPILGTPETVRAFSAEALFAYHRSWFAPDRLVLTAAGNVTHERVLELAEREFSAVPPAGPIANPQAPQAEAPIRFEKMRDLEQVHLCLGVPSYPLAHERRFAVAVLNNLLGGGMSSRLFQNIREKLGLVYAVFSELTPYSDAGMLSVYAATALETTGQVVDLVVKEFRAMKESPSASRSCAAPRTTSRAPSCFPSSPPARACPISPARSSISTASTPSTKSSSPSKPSPARRSTPSPANSSSPSRSPSPSSAISTASPSTAPASPASF